MPVISGGGGRFNGGTIGLPLVVSTPGSLGGVAVFRAEDSLHTSAGFQVQIDEPGGTDANVTAVIAPSHNGAAGLNGSDDALDGSFSLGSDIGLRVFARSTLANGDTIVNIAGKSGASVVSALADGSGFLAGGVVPRAVSPNGVITSGALPTVQLVTATGAQILTTRDAETITPCTFNPGAATTATVTVALSPDNVTYSTLGVETEPAGVAFDGTIHLVKVRVPAGWYLKLTVNAQAVLGLTTYY